ncbi:VOC family protein [Mastigocoleus sp. MO_188.B34]|uniref:VOC family protein n=1 Tax=Mastigocoleus sp. MO_188.B34 TaxID=3036635 RepID=UPI00263840E0|nr:VOC family protein [Mastigocoleus sp. MO_188.B34]MDJ0697365.1 glyoxalase [Mastigocoleus sp. MO_188.B34]
MQQQTIFHLAFPVTNIAKAKTYYVDGLGCIPGRESRHALILNLHGHQIVAHLTKEPLSPQRNIYPRHFGIVFTVEQDWENLLVRAKKQELLFREEPKDRFLGSPLEHRTFFLEDPFYNLMEFKYYRHPEAIFGSAQFTQVGDRD